MLARSASSDTRALNCPVLAFRLDQSRKMQKRSGKKAMSCGGAAAKKARTPAKAVAKLGAAGKEAGEDDETTMTFFMELDVLECRICFMPFEAEVYMCKNGHGACADCCLRINRKCWCCSESIGDLRNRQLESFLAAMVTHCRFTRYGCGETLRYTEKRAHEEACVHAPFDCPFGGCGYRGLQLYAHVQDEHAPDAAYAISSIRGTTVTLRKAAPFMVLVQPGRARVLLLLNGGDVLAGRSLSLLCLGPRPEGDVELEYSMEVSGGGEPGALALSASGTVPCARRLEGFRAKGFLFVPDAYWGSSGTVSVRVRV